MLQLGARCECYLENWSVQPQATLFYVDMNLISGNNETLWIDKAQKGLKYHPALSHPWEGWAQPGGGQFGYKKQEI